MHTGQGGGGQGVRDHARAQVRREVHRRGVHHRGPLRDSHGAGRLRRRRRAADRRRMLMGRKGAALDNGERRRAVIQRYIQPLYTTLMAQLGARCAGGVSFEQLQIMLSRPVSLVFQRATQAGRAVGAGARPPCVSRAGQPARATRSEERRASKERWASGGITPWVERRSTTPPALSRPLFDDDRDDECPLTVPSEGFTTARVSHRTAPYSPPSTQRTLPTSPCTTER